MKKIILTLIILVFGKVYSQNKLEGVILDDRTGKPIEYVDIFNNKDYTSTNSEGKFLFKSIEDSIKIQLLGYEPIHSKFQQLSTDTIYLQSKFELLNEVILSQTNSIKTVFKNIHQNYPFEPYTESFFLRSVLKKDGQIVKLQDLNGLISRKILLATSKNSLPKNNYTVEVQNMRKAVIKDNEVYFEMFSFDQFLTAITSIAISPSVFDFAAIESDNNLIKYKFSPKTEAEFTTTGYYLVNTNDNSFNEFYLLDFDNEKDFQKRRDLKYRTVYYELFVSFSKNNIVDKYYLDKAKLKANVEVRDKDEKTIQYETEYLWIASHRTDKKVTKKISLSKDIFKLDIPYDEHFWNIQNNLMLTDELKLFIDDLGSLNNDFEIQTNIE
jgi:hypothetical protein